MENVGNVEVGKKRKLQRRSARRERSSDNDNDHDNDHDIRVGDILESQDAVDEQVQQPLSGGHIGNSSNSSNSSSSYDESGNDRGNRGLEERMARDEAREPSTKRGKEARRQQQLRKKAQLYDAMKQGDIAPSKDSLVNFRVCSNRGAERDQQGEREGEAEFQERRNDNENDDGKTMAAVPPPTFTNEPSSSVSDPSIDMPPPADFEQSSSISKPTISKPSIAEQRLYGRQFVSPSNERKGTNHPLPFKEERRQFLVRKAMGQSDQTTGPMHGTNFAAGSQTSKQPLVVQNDDIERLLEEESQNAY